MAPEHTLSENGNFREHKRFSIVLRSLDLKFIQKVQHIVRSPTNHPYQDLKTALIKPCKLNENNCFDILFNITEIGGRKPIKMLNEICQLLKVNDVTITQANAAMGYFVNWG